MPAYAFDQLKTPVDWQFHTYPSTACRIAGNEGCYMPRGKMLGGSSSINSMNFVRGMSNDFDEWAEAGNSGWSYDEILPYFKKFEGNQNMEFVSRDNGKYHSASGPVKIVTAPTLPFDKMIMDFLNESGLHYFEDINTEKKLPGYTLLQKYNNDGKRSSTAYTYLAANKNRTNLHIIKHAYVDRILLDEDNVAYGVEFTYKDVHKLKVNCTREVIVSAGTIQSPTLLMRSGIGPKEHLEEHNISCKANLAVGDNYADHISTFLLFKYNNILTGSIPPLALLHGLYEYLLLNTEALGTASVLVAEVDTTNTSTLPDILYAFENIPQGFPKKLIEKVNIYTGLGSLNDFIVEANENSSILFLWLTALKPESRGFIRLSENLRENITSNYLSEASDRATLVRGINYFLDLMKSKAFRRAGAELLRINIEECDKYEYLSNEYWECYIKYISNSIGHQVGTSKMGSDENSVVDSELRVYKTKGLRQIDCGM